VPALPTARPGLGAAVAAPSRGYGGLAFLATGPVGWRMRVNMSLFMDILSMVSGFIVRVNKVIVMIGGVIVMTSEFLSCSKVSYSRDEIGMWNKKKERRFFFTVYLRVRHRGGRGSLHYLFF
jgi:hypothetical protein